MSNSIFVSNYKEQTGWGEAGRSYIECFNRAGINITPSFFDMGGPMIKDHFRYLDLENKIYEGYDHVIQLLLPGLLEHVEGYNNIGVFFLESEGVLENGQNIWLEKIKKMDSLWVSTVREKRWLKKYGFDVHIVPQPFDMSVYTQEHTSDIELPDTYKFYFIGEPSERKNINRLILGWYLSPANGEDTDLVIKSSNGMAVREICENLKRTYKLSTKDPLIIGKDMSDSDIYFLHQQCDCFVSASSEECLGRPIVDAIGFGNKVMVTAGTSPAEELPVSLTFESYKDRCLVNSRPIESVYTTSEKWHYPIVDSISEKLDLIRKVKTDKHNYKSIEALSMEKIGEQIKCLLKT